MCAHRAGAGKPAVNGTSILALVTPNAPGGGFLVIRGRLPLCAAHAGAGMHNYRFSIRQMQNHAFCERNEETRDSVFPVPQLVALPFHSFFETCCAAYDRAFYYCSHLLILASLVN